MDIRKAFVLESIFPPITRNVGSPSSAHPIQKFARSIWNQSIAKSYNSGEILAASKAISSGCAAIKSSSALLFLPRFIGALSTSKSSFCRFFLTERDRFLLDETSYTLLFWNECSVHPNQNKHQRNATLTSWWLVPCCFSYNGAMKVTEIQNKREAARFTLNCCFHVVAHE